LPPAGYCGCASSHAAHIRRSKVMGNHRRSIQFVPLSVLAVSLAALLPVRAFAVAQRGGHRSLSTPRPCALSRQGLLGRPPHRRARRVHHLEPVG
jgi:hypothetical protein